MLSKKSQENISSTYGKYLRMNRSIQVEGAFTILKENMKLRKLKVRGKNRVLREICLICLEYNLNSLIQRGKTNKKRTTLHPLKTS